MFRVSVRTLGFLRFFGRVESAAVVHVLLLSLSTKDAIVSGGILIHYVETFRRYAFYWYFALTRCLHV